MLRYALLAAAVALIAIPAMPTVASAKSCAPDYLIAQGAPHVSEARARASARAAWRDAAAMSLGEKWNSWRRAENAAIDCAAFAGTGTCLAVATPCAR